MQPDHDRPLPRRFICRVEEIRLEIVAEWDLRLIPFPRALLRARCRISSGTLNNPASQPSPVPEVGSFVTFSRLAPAGSSPSAHSIRLRLAVASSDALN